MQRACRGGVGGGGDGVVGAMSCCRKSCDGHATVGADVWPSSATGPRRPPLPTPWARPLLCVRGLGLGWRRAFLRGGLFVVREPP